MQRLGFVFMILFGTACCAHGQGMFLEENENGLGFQGAMDRGDDFDTFGGAVGYSTTGIFDFGLEWTRTEIPIFDSEYEIRHDQWIPYLNIGLVRPLGNRKVGVELRGSYAFGSSSSDASNSAEVQTSALTLGPVVYFRNPVGSHFTIQPEFAAYYIAVSAKAEGGDDTRTEGDPIVSAILHLAIGSKSDTRIIVSPGWRAVGTHESWTLGVRIVTPLNRKHPGDTGS